MIEDECERVVQQTLAAGNVARAVARALDAHGPEAFGFLVVAMGDRVVARELYATLRERLRRALPRFTWRTSLRAWVHAMAWHELAPERARAPGNGARQSSHPIEPKTTIAARPVLASSAIAELRGSMSPADRGLLILHVDRQLTSFDLAGALAPAAATDAEIARAAADFDRRILVVRAALAETAIAKRLLPPR